MAGRKTFLVLLTTLFVAGGALAFASAYSSDIWQGARNPLAKERTHDVETAFDRPAGYPAMAEEERAVTVSLYNKEGIKVGDAILEQKERGVLIRLDATGLPPEQHGFHIHETGACDAPDFTSAGDHFNPNGRQHGLNNPAGPHAGDMPNITVGKSGTVTAEVLNTRVTLKKGEPNSLLKPGGSSLVIHAQPDDMKSDPSGNSGERIACGVIGE